MAEITAPGKIRQFLPMRAPSIMVTLDPIHVPSPISTSLCMVTKGSITTLSAILACGCIYAKGWIILIGFWFSYNLSHQLSFNYYTFTYHANAFHLGNAAAYGCQ